MGTKVKYIYYFRVPWVAVVIRKKRLQGSDKLCNFTQFPDL